MKRSILLALACVGFLFAAAPAVVAQPAGNKQKALDLYEKANVKYNLGRWQEAIDLFTQAYEAYSAPEFLFNIAQAHRQAGHCKEAIFFYRRYLANKPDAPNKTEVQGFIGDLESGCKGAGTGGTGGGTTGTGGGTTGGGTTGGGTTGRGTAGTGGSGTTGGGSGTTGGGRGTTGTGTGGAGTTGHDSSGGAGDGTRVADAGTITSGDDQAGDGSGGDASLTAVSERPSLFTSSVAIGPSFLSAGNLETPVLVGFSIAGGYPLQVGPVQLEPGAVVSYTPVPWKGDPVGEMETPTGTAGLTGLLANVGAAYEVLPRLSVRGDLGAGVLIVSGLDLGSPFLEPDEFADAPLSMFHLRAALGAEYAITSNIAVQAQPVVFSMSPADKLKEGISSLTRFELLFGASYRM